jgi:hypothetical protein
MFNGEGFGTAKPAINEIQKSIIESFVNFIFDEVEQTNIPVKLLDAMLDPALTQEVKTPALLEIVTKVHEILNHPCPQNRYVGEPSAASGKVDGIIDNDVYYWTNGFGSTVMHEPRGLLGLTARNDSTALPITKEAVVDYIRTLILKKKSEYLLIEHPRRKSFDTPFETLLFTKDLFEKNDVEGIKKYLLSLDFAGLESTLVDWAINEVAYKRDILVNVLKQLSDQNEIFSGAHLFISQKENYYQYPKVLQALFRRPEHAKVIAENMLSLCKLGRLSEKNYRFVLLNPQLGLIDNQKLAEEIQKHKSTHVDRCDKRTLSMIWAPSFEIADHPNVFKPILGNSNSINQKN